MKKVTIVHAVAHLEKMFSKAEGNRKINWYEREEYINENYPDDWGWLAVLKEREKVDSSNATTRKVQPKYTWKADDKITGKHYKATTADGLAKMIFVSKASISVNCNTGKLLYQRYKITREKLKKPQKSSVAPKMKDN